MPLHVSSTCTHHQEVKIALHSLWYHHTYWWPSRAQVERGLQHMCSKHAEAWNKLIVKQKFCASIWLITEINVILFFYVIKFIDVLCFTFSFSNNYRKRTDVRWICVSLLSLRVSRFGVGSRVSRDHRLASGFLRFVLFSSKVSYDYQLPGSYSMFSRITLQTSTNKNEKPRI